MAGPEVEPTSAHFDDFAPELVEQPAADAPPLSSVDDTPARQQS